MFKRTLVLCLEPRILLFGIMVTSTLFFKAWMDPITCLICHLDEMYSI